MSTSASASFMPGSVTPEQYKHFAVFATRDWYHAVGEAVTRSGDEGLLRRVYAAEVEAAFAVGQSTLRDTAERKVHFRS